MEGAWVGLLSGFCVGAGVETPGADVGRGVAVGAAVGAQVGDMVEFGGLLGSAPVMPLHSQTPADFIARGGRIPAPLHSLRN